MRYYRRSNNKLKNASIFRWKQTRLIKLLALRTSMKTTLPLHDWSVAISLRTGHRLLVFFKYILCRNCSTAVSLQQGRFIFWLPSSDIWDWQTPESSTSCRDHLDICARYKTTSCRASIWRWGWCKCVQSGDGYPCQSPNGCFSTIVRSSKEKNRKKIKVHLTSTGSGTGTTVHLTMANLNNIKAMRLFQVR